MYKIDILLKQNQKIFHTKDLALLWQIKNLNTLYTSIKRYVQKGILVKIHKGLYATVPLENLDPLKLGMAVLHSFAYLSTESVLTLFGVMFQSANYLTFVSNHSRKFSVGNYSYLVRRMKDEFLYQSAGIEDQNGVKTATVERAVADLLYFNPQSHFDNRQAINWPRVKEMQKEVGFK